MSDNLPILLILVLSVLGSNQSVATACTFVLLIKLLGFDSWLPVLQDKGMSIGITVLTAAILTPLASGRISLENMLGGFTTTSGTLALLAGIFAAWAAGRGLQFMSTSPDMISSIVLGTVLGVCLFKGIAVGPLIASGLVSIILAFCSIFK